MAASLKGRVPWPLLSRGECTDPCLDRLLLFLSGFITYYIECCCLHFRYNQGNENNKCRRERWRADYAPSVGKFIQALEITLKIGNKHLFQTRVREFQQEQAITVCYAFSRPDSHRKTQFEGRLLPTTLLLSVFHMELRHICQTETCVWLPFTLCKIKFSYMQFFNFDAFNLHPSLQFQTFTLSHFMFLLFLYYLFML